MTVAHRVLGLQIFDSFSAHRVLRLSWIFYSFSAHWVHGLQIFDSFSAHWVLGLRIFDVPWVFLGSVGLPLLRVFWALSVWDFLDSEFLSFPGSKFLGFLNCSEFSRLPLLEFRSMYNSSSLFASTCSVKQVIGFSRALDFIQISWAKIS